MKRKRVIWAVLLMLAAVLLAGCGAIVVEDAEPVRIGAIVYTKV